MAPRLPKKRHSHERMSRSELSERLGALQLKPLLAKGSAESAELRAILHELEVSQIELEMQNRELVESRRAVDESHEKYVELYDFAPVGYLTLDSKGTIQEINLTAAELLGSERRYLIDRSLAPKIAPEDRQKFREHLMICHQTGKKQSSEVTLVNRGTPIQLLSTVTRNRVSGEITFRCAMTDLTEQKRTEVELKEERARAELASQTKSVFLANMSHEIRTPLAAILGFTEQMDHCDDPIERTKYASVVNRNGLALTKLIDDILDLTKVEAGRLRLEKVDFNIRQLVKEITALFHTPIATKNLELVVKIDAQTPTRINSDPTRIRQILINLLGNATKFTLAGSIHLHVKPAYKNGEMSCISFCVKDTGIGMTEEQATKLFQPFSQADDSTTRRFGGSGLGLALSKKLAKALGGDISVEACAPGVGSTFVASVEANLADSIYTEPVIEPSYEAPSDVRHRPRILLVEDSIDNQTLVKLVLNKAGMSVDVANNGVEGVRMAEANEYDVVLMDMQMPVLDGYKATEQLRQDGYVRPIVALTAHAMLEDRQRSLELGCDAHLTKPLDSKLLVETISRLQMGAHSQH